MQAFQNLAVWQMSRKQVLETYRLSQTFPDTEKYGLTSQLRRAASSVCANLAEGCGRGSDLDYRRFVQIAIGSACEWECFLILANDLGYLETSTANHLQVEVIKIRCQLIKLAKALSQTIASSSPSR